MYMAIRKIVTIPDPVLRNKAQKVNGVGEEEKKLAQDLLDTLEVAGIFFPTPPKTASTHTKITCL